MNCPLRIVSVSGLAVAMLSVTACEGTPGRRLSVRPGTSNAQAVVAEQRAAQADAGQIGAGDVQAEPAAAVERQAPAEAPARREREREQRPATGGGEWGAASEPARGTQRTGGTAGAGGAGGVTPVQLPAPMTKTERATLREQALNLLVNTAAGGSPEERANAVEALTRTPARLSMVLEGALQDTSPAVRAVGAMAAGRTRATQATPLLRRLMQDESRLVRSAAVYGLYKLGQNPDATMLAGMLFDASPRVRAQGAFIMGEMGEKSALGPLREAAKLPAGRAAPGEVRVMDLQIAEARIKLGDEEALADVRSALFPARPEDLEGCLLAMQIVGQVRDRASVNRLIELTADKDPNKQEMPGEIRVGAAMALARLGQPEGSYIAREYFAGASEALRAQSAHLFGELGRGENLPILARMMADPDGRVRVAAASAVVRITERE